MIRRFSLPVSPLAICLGLLLLTPSLRAEEVVRVLIADQQPEPPGEEEGDEPPQRPVLPETIVEGNPQAFPAHPLDPAAILSAGRLARASRGGLRG